MKVQLLLLVALVLPLALVGCQTQSTPVAAPSSAPGSSAPSGEAHDEHDHGAGPHGGTIGEFGGGKYHTEFVVDHGKQEATVYILGEDAKTAVPLKTDKLLLSLTEPAVDVELAAQPLEGEAEGMSSRFVGTHEALGKVQEFAGSITAEVEGTPYAGEFKEEAEGHAHKHEEGAHK